MRLALATVAAAVSTALAPAPVAAAVVPSYVDDDGGGGNVYGVFYVCTPDRCGWWFCWPGIPCYPI